MALRVKLLLALIELSAQFVLTSGNNPFIPPEDNWMSNYLQSTFMSSTDVLFIVDSRKFFTSGISGYVLKLFSRQKTFRLVTMDNLKSHAQSNFSLIETLEQESKYNFDSRRFEYWNELMSSSQQTQIIYYNKIKISRRTTIVILIKDAILISLIRDVILKTPTELKIVFMYDECILSTNKLEKKLKQFSRKSWSQFRVLFTYFIPFCLRTLKLNYTNTSSPQLFNVVSMTMGERQKINNRMSNKRFINSLYVHDPFYHLSNPQRWNDGNDQNYGTLRKFNLSLDHGTMKGIYVNKIVKVNGYRLRIVFHPTTMAVLKTEIPFMSRNLTPEILANPAWTTESYFGLEIEVLKELAKRMNFTPDIRPSTDGKVFGSKTINSTFDGGIGDIIYNRVDFGMNGYFIRDYETREVEFTTAVSDDKLCVLARKPNLIPNYLLLFKVFSPELWLLIACTVVIASMLYSFLLFAVRKCNLVDLTTKQRLPFNSNNKHYNEILTIIAECTRIIAILMTAPQFYRFKLSRWEKIYAAGCFWWGLNIIGAFQGSLVNVFTNQITNPRINTLREFDRSNLKIFVRFPELIKDVFGNDDGGTYLGNLKKKMNTTEDNDIIKRIALNGNVASLARHLDMNKYATMIPYGPDGKFPLYFINECPRTYKIAYLFPRSSVYLPLVNIILGRFASAGLLVKWQKDTEYIFQFAGQLNNRGAIRESLTMITVSHLQLGFFVLFFGHIASFLVLIVEIYWESA